MTALQRLGVAAVIVTALLLFLSLAAAGCAFMFREGGIAASKGSPPPACQLYGGHFSWWSGWHCDAPSGPVPD